ncbi:hypothetical protein LPJ61_001252 [Coemansia biformis]|uniref:RGS domain-containing protein n=1 Tax=Coemansia biformis TaxID=1286918 RepID=A0A9W7YGT0_9FUNG|nr:hypothetical protein LPJ61_001252 [Coemansia biformis]
MSNNAATRYGDGGRGRSESDGMARMSARSSGDRAPLSTFFESQAWQRMSTTLPAAVQDPLNIDELEREERLMPFTEVAVGEMGTFEPLGRSEATGGNPRSSLRTSALLPGSVGAATGPKSEKSAGIDWAYMQDHNLRTGGLPSLDQVLTRRTRAPLALRDFAVHCSVRQPQARRWLEFYMAARTHEKMCLAYESDLRHAKARSQYASNDVGVPAKHPAAAEAHEDVGSARRAAAHNATIVSLSRAGQSTPHTDNGPGADDEEVRPLDDLQGGSFRRSRRQSTRMALQIQTAAEAIFMRYFRAALDPSLNQGISGHWRAGGGARERGKMGSLRRMLTQKAGTGGAAAGGLGGHAAHGLQTTLDDPYHQGYGVTDSVYDAARPSQGSAHGISAAGGAGGGAQQGQLGSTLSLTMSREYLTTPITAGTSQMPAGAGAGAAAGQSYMLQMGHGTSRGLGGAFGSGRHHLYYHMPWPPEILTDIEQKLVRDGAALDPALFSEALLYAYDVLDTYYFPIFVADAVSRNVTRDHCVLRVFVAFLLLWFGFALPLALILLNEQPRARRAWSVVPQLIGWWNMAVGFGGCDPLLAALRKYQSPIMKDHAHMPHRPRAKQAWSLRRRLDDWHRAWFSTRISVDMTATRMVRARSVRWFLGALVMTALSTAILCAAPGTRIYK